MLEIFLSRGCVFAGRFRGIDHEKYFVVVGISGDTVRCCSVFINSNIPFHIRNNAASLSMQVNIKGVKYDFLTHDSFVSCGNVQKQPVSDLRKCRYIGKIDDSDLNNILETVINSGTLTEKEIILYFTPEYGK